MATVVGLLLGGCSWPSDWDRQWEDITHAIREGNLQEAKTRLTGLLPAAQQEGPKNPHYAQIIFQLGTIAQLEGNHQQAEAYFWEALPLWAQSVGPEHPNMADTLLAIAEIFEKKNKSNMALPLLKRAVSIQEKAWGRTDPRLLPSLKQYLHLLELTQQASDAQLIQQQIRHIQEGDRGSIP